MDRNARNALHQCQTRIGRQAKTTQAVEFFNILTSPQLLDTTEALQPEHRERLYPPKGYPFSSTNMRAGVAERTERPLAS